MTRTHLESERVGLSEWWGRECVTETLRFRAGPLQLGWPGEQKLQGAQSPLRKRRTFY